MLHHNVSFLTYSCTLLSCRGFVWLLGNLNQCCWFRDTCNLQVWCLVGCCLATKRSGSGGGVNGCGSCWGVVVSKKLLTFPGQNSICPSRSCCLASFPGPARSSLAVQNWPCAFVACSTKFASARISYCKRQTHRAWERGYMLLHLGNITIIYMQNIHHRSGKFCY